MALEQEAKLRVTLDLQKSLGAVQNIKADVDKHTRRITEQKQDQKSVAELYRKMDEKFQVPQKKVNEGISKVREYSNKVSQYSDLIATSGMVIGAGVGMALEKMGIPKGATESVVNSIAAEVASLKAKIDTFEPTLAQTKEFFLAQMKVTHRVPTMDDVTSVGGKLWYANSKIEEMHSRQSLFMTSMLTEAFLGGGRH